MGSHLSKKSGKVPAKHPWRSAPVSHKKKVDDFDPSKLMPAEIWEKVLEYLVEPRDIVNASQSCHLFDDMLWEKSNGCRLEQVLPLLLKWLQFTEALTMRTSCKRIQTCLDLLLEQLPLLSENRNLGIIQDNRHTPPQLAPSFEWNLFKHLLPCHRQGVNISSAQKVERFREEMEGSLQDPQGRPFVGKYLALHNLRAGQSFLHPAFQMITQFHIKLAHLDLSNFWVHDIPVLERYKIVRKMLTAVPNLESFQGPYVPDLAFGQDVAGLQRYIAQNPLPPLPLIKQMLLFDMNRHFFLEIFSRYGGQLECLQLGNCFPHHHEDGLPAVLQFPVLVDLELKLEWDEHTLLRRMEGGSLVSLKLHLKSWFFQFILPGDFCQIFCGFPNLVVVQLEIKEGADWDAGMSVQAPVQHPSVKKFAVRSPSGFVPVSLRFCLEMFPNLEVFSIQDSVIDHADSTDHDLSLLGEGLMYQSALWGKSPSLQLIQRNNLKFTRNGYLQSQAN